jgi:hypothetical protein
VALEVTALVRTLVDRRRVSYRAISDALSELDAPLSAAEIPLRADFTTAMLQAVRSPRCGRTAPARTPTVAWPRSSPQRRRAHVFEGPHSDG